MNKITVYANVFKKEDSGQPDYRGKCDVDGETYNVSLWVNREIGGVPVHLTGQINEDSDYPQAPPGEEDESPHPKPF